MKKYGKWTESAACKSRAHCRHCLNGALGDAFYEQYDMPDGCPHGVTPDDLATKPKVRLGGQKDYTDCKPCKERMLRKMKS